MAYKNLKALPLCGTKPDLWLAWKITWFRLVKQKSVVVATILQLLLPKSS